ncbi:hypothetical protein [Halorubellus litoreus]|uniref:Repeat domain-containing protein n=1 Tax=Halorubellus litoreus TaxID=755308 RepID=A0ABD5V900_9EURY
MHRRRLLAAAASATALGALAGCQGAFPTEDATTTPRSSTLPADVSTGDVAYTYGQPSGNRVADGAGDVTATEPVSVGLSGTPAWLVGAPDPSGDGTKWVVALEDGTLEAVRVVDGDATVAAVSPPSLPAGTPPAFDAHANRVLAPPRGTSTLTHPTPTPAGTVAVRADGSLQVGDRTHEVDPLPDARVVVGDEHAVVLAGATRQYDHGALGDGVEASDIATISLQDGSVSTFPVGRGVVEGTSPILADVTGDGTESILVTESDADAGARIVAYDHDGRVVARGPAVGSGYRWRHQLAVAPFHPDGVPEVAVVKTPHIGGTVEFYRRDGETFRLVATADGYSSHALGSRNLDGARAFDVDGDGTPELVVPTDDRLSLAVLSRTDDGVRRSGVLDPPATIRGNLATATVDGTTTLAATTTDLLTVWSR